LGWLAAGAAGMAGPGRNILQVKTTNNTTDPHHFRREQNEQICERTMDNDPPPVKPWSDVNKTFLQELIDAAVLPLLLSSRREEAQEEEG